MAIIAAVTTHEARAPYIRPAVESIVAQQGVDRVLVLTGNPFVSSRLAPVLAGLSVEIVEAVDIGPGKKHLAALHCDPTDTIVTFDDDMIYAADHAATLVAELAISECPTGPIGFLAGIPLRTVKEGMCNLLHGEVGWAYKASWVDTNLVLQYGANPCCYHNDDIYMGWLFREQGLNCHTFSVPRSISHPEPNRAAARIAAINASRARRHRLRLCMEMTFWRSQPQ